MDAPARDPGSGVSVETLVSALRATQKHIRTLAQPCEDDVYSVKEHKEKEASRACSLGRVIQHISQRYLYHHAQMVYIRRARDRAWSSPLQVWEQAAAEIGRHILT